MATQPATARSSELIPSVQWRPVWAGAIAAAAMDGTAASVLAMVALFAATVNVVGGYMITHRMLRMFSPSKPAQDHDES